MKLRLSRRMMVGICALYSATACGSVPSTEVSTKNDSSASLAEALGSASPQGLSMASFGSIMLVSGVNENKVLRLASCDSGGSCESVGADAVNTPGLAAAQLVESPSRPMVAAAFCDPEVDCGAPVTFKMFSVDSEGTKELMTFRSDIVDNDNTGRLRFDVVSSDDAHAIVMIVTDDRSALLRLDLSAGKVLSEIPVPGIYRQFVPRDDGSVVIVMDQIGELTGPNIATGSVGSVGATLLTVGADGTLSARDIAEAEFLRSKDNRIFALSEAGVVTDAENGKRIGSVEPDRSAASDSVGSGSVCSGRTLVSGSYNESSNEGTFWFASADTDSVRSQTLKFSGVVDEFVACSAGGKIFVADPSHNLPGLEREGQTRTLSLQVLPE